MFDRNKPLALATLGDLEDLLRTVLVSNDHQHTEVTDKNVVRGLEGICQALGVGKTKAQEIKNSGVIAPAINEVGPRLFYVNVPLAQKLYRQI